jgi:hypothetical protein
MSKITDRIAAETGIPNLLGTLSALPASDLQSLLLEVFQLRARLAKVARTTPLTEPSSVDARKLNEFDRIAFQCAKNFDAIDLSPVAPFALSHILGGIDQNNVVTTIRNAEVLGDSTEPLALECARRRTQQEEVRLACSHRLIRMQPFDVPGFTPHFRLFALASAGRDKGSYDFEVRHLVEHIRVYLALCRALHLGETAVEITDMQMMESWLAQRGVSKEDVRAAVRAHRPGSSQRFLSERVIELPEIDHPIARRVSDALGVAVRHNSSRLEGFGYYSTFAMRITIAGHAAIDGGFTDWTARLLNNRKERLLTSGIGTEFVARALWQPSADSPRPPAPGD